MVTKTRKVKMNKIAKRSFAVLMFALFGTSGAWAEKPTQVVGDVTVINEESNPIPVIIQGAPETVETIVEYRYVGITTHVFDNGFYYEGATGTAALHNLYLETSRMEKKGMKTRSQNPSVITLGVATR